MSAQRRRPGGPLATWRLALWGGMAILLACPLLAMRFTDEVRWERSDFAAGAVLLTALGIAVELAHRLIRHRQARMIAIAVSVATIMLIWADAAVGVF